MLQATLFVLAVSLFACAANADERLLFSFAEPDAPDVWRTVNDGVMGGVSEGSVKINEDQNLEFYGTLSLENNGGFASVRASGDHLAMKADESILLRVRGDGREYNFNLYARSDLEGYSFRQSFQTVEGEWVEIALPVDQFVATWRGRVFPDIELDPAKVAGVGILLGDGKPGGFNLEVQWIKADAASGESSE